MRKKIGFFILFAFVFVSGTVHLAAMEAEKEQAPATNHLEKYKELIKEELRKKALQAASRMYFDSPCGAGTRARAVQEELSSSQQFPAVDPYSEAPKTQGKPFYRWPGGPIEFYINSNE